MALQLVKPGHWHDPALADAAGTFAVVIGVSHYDHLPAAADEQALAQTYGLGQLNVSATTAYAFFDWLRSSYNFERAPLSQCWILTSPTAAEAALLPELGQTPQPTLRACEDALGEAVQAIEQLSPAYISESRFIFFFSGHGLERYPNQLLCPCDYLRPPARNPNGALSTNNLRGGLRRYSLRDDFFFLDACRSNPQEMVHLKLEGTSTLVEMPAFQASANRHSPIVWGTKSGAESWQPQAPSPGLDGLSIFGRALIEALIGSATTDQECGHPPGHITVDRVHSYSRRRVQTLLEQHGQTSLDPVRKGGDYGEACITTPRKKPPAAPLGIRPPDDPAAVVPPPEPQTDGPRAVRVMMQSPGIITDKSESDLHGVFNSEKLSFLWHRAQAVPLRAPGQKSKIRIEAFDWVGREVARVTISVEGSGSHWLQMTDVHGVSYAAILPGDPDGPLPRYVVELARQHDAPMRHFDVSLSEDNQDRLGVIARLWEKYREASARAAVSTMDANFIEHALYEKMNGPLAATVAGLLLLRARRYEQLHDWLANLAKRFPYRTDGAVLRAEQIRQTRQSDAFPAELVQHVLAVAQGTLPELAEVFGYAVDQTRELLRFAFEHAPQSAEIVAARQSVYSLDQRFDRASRYFRGGGLCSAFMGPAAEIGVQLVLAG